MKNLLKIVVVFLFVALVAIVIITGVQKMMTQDVHYDPGPQVPADYTDSPILDRDAELSDSSGFDAEATTTESDSDDEDLTGSPVSISTIFRCTDAQKEAEICTLEYAPVCGLVQVQCVTTPCDPIPETFGNACGACAQGNVDSYTQGECALE